MTIDDLRALRERVNSAIATLMDGGAKPSEKKRKPNKNKGKPTVWGDFSSKIQAEHKEQIATFKASHPDEKCPHLAYVTQYRKDNTVLYEDFKSAWKLEHPSDTEASEGETQVEKSDQAEKPEKAKRPPMSDAQKAAMKAGREKKKAATAAAKASMTVGGAITESPAPVVSAPVVSAPVTPVLKKVNKAVKANV